MFFNIYFPTDNKLVEIISIVYQNYKKVQTSESLVFGDRDKDLNDERHDGTGISRHNL